MLQKLVQFGDDTYGEERAFEKLFRCIPEKYKQMARSIESLLDLSTMSIEEAIGLSRGWRAAMQLEMDAVKNNLVVTARSPLSGCSS
jgi:hypothetical protein